ncbi:MAG: histidinol-phosphatase HisJ family protein [Candidatus Wallbacteria bacterium]
MSEFPKVDFHVHPNYSFDATHEPIEDYCRRALELGLKQICFTPHYTTVPAVIEKYGYVRKNGKRFPVTGDWLADYITEVRKADKKYAGRGLRVFAGLEVDYAPEIHDALKKRLTEEYEFDFLLGSVHLVEGDLDIMVPKEADEIFRLMKPVDFYNSYFANVEKTIDSGLFRSIAHIEGYRRYGARINPDFGDDSKIPAAHFEKMFTKMAEKGMALEINLALFRNGLNIINPVEKVLEIAKDCGIKEISIGSDAHRVEDLAQKAECALTACEKIGFKIFTL